MSEFEPPGDIRNGHISGHAVEFPAPVEWPIIVTPLTSGAVKSSFKSSAYVSMSLPCQSLLERPWPKPPIDDPCEFNCDG